LVGGLFLLPLVGGAADKSTEKKTNTLDVELREQAGAINKLLRKRYIKGSGDTINVAVLKFRVKRAGEKDFTMNAGPLNMQMANRLEVALVLDTDDKDKSVRMIEKASDTAADQFGKRPISYLDAKGRKKLFTFEYSPAWGQAEEKLKADVFLTGDVVIHDDCAKADVRIVMFDKSGNEPEKIAEFTCWADPRTLMESGESVRIPKGAKGGFTDDDFTKAGEDALKHKKKVNVEPGGFMWQSPVEIKIFYTDKEDKKFEHAEEQKVDIVDGVGARVKTPTEDQLVGFQLTNKSDTTVGVVLMVNGESTIYREQGDPDYMYKWILDKGKSCKIRGFQMPGDDTNAAPFTVLGDLESAKQAANYKEFAGTFSIAVYQAQSTDGSGSPPVTDDTMKAIARGALRGARLPKPTTLQGLKTTLQKIEAEQHGSKGLIVPGPGSVDSKIQKVDFKPNLTSGIRGNIYYYTPSTNN
jgi:hypothetical protein